MSSSVADQILTDLTGAEIFLFCFVFSVLVSHDTSLCDKVIWTDLGIQIKPRTIDGEMRNPLATREVLFFLVTSPSPTITEGSFQLVFFLEPS